MSRTEVMMKESLEEIKGKINKLEKECDYLRNELAKYKNKDELTIKFDREMRRKNILIHGIQCEREEDKRVLYEKVLQWLKEKLEVNVEEEPLIDDVIRLGNKQQKNRPVLVKCTNCIAKYVILHRAKLLAGLNYSITEDFSYDTRIQRRKLIPFVKEARKNGHFARLVFDKIIVDNQTYSYEQYMEKRRNVTSRLETGSASANNRHEAVVDGQEEVLSIRELNEDACAVSNNFDSNSSLAAETFTADPRSTDINKRSVNQLSSVHKYQGIVHDQEYFDKLMKPKEESGKPNLVERLQQGRILRSQTLAGTFSDQNPKSKKSKNKHNNPNLRKWLNSSRK